MAQRVAIARALAGEPRLLIADEPTTALDVTVQAEILGLIRELQDDRGMSVLVVTHDWGVVADICDRVVVMYAGQVVERAERPRCSTPVPPVHAGAARLGPPSRSGRRHLAHDPGDVPHRDSWPAGCRFHPRCSFATPECGDSDVLLEEAAPGRHTRCLHHGKLVAR